MNLEAELRRDLVNGRLDLPFPGSGQTALRHRALMEIARTNLSVARLAEAHVDAVAILHEAGRPAHPGSLYGVWASEVPGRVLRLIDANPGFHLTGSKMFCTGASIVDRALLTVTVPEKRLIEIDLRGGAGGIRYDQSEWKTTAFSETRTSTAYFDGVRVGPENFVGDSAWYLDRPGFWHGACAPAACWAGGALGLHDYAMQNTSENNPHALAHLGAIKARSWALKTILHTAADEIDANPLDAAAAKTRALIVRHLVEDGCLEIMRRFGSAYGPRPLAFDADMSRRLQELTLYVRQSHAESDLEQLGRS